MMRRIVVAETLDGLAADDPAAMSSRRDLQRVHRVMGTRGIVLRALADMLRFRSATRPLRILELGAGDGSLMLRVAEARLPVWSKVEITLLDRQSLITQATIDRYAQCGWTAKQKVADVMDWAAQADEGSPGGKRKRWDVIVACLFLHHFDGAPLHALINMMAARCNRVFACEPRRSKFALAGSQLVGVLGANAVTREDAVLSVHAGFCDHELTRVWPRDGDPWRTQEYSAGLFSHCFRAERAGAS